MKNQNKEQKSAEQPDEWSLTKKKFPYLNNRKTKFHISDSFGKKEPVIVRAFWATLYVVVTFFDDLAKAIIVIIKGIM